MDAMCRTGLSVGEFIAAVLGDLRTEGSVSAVFPVVAINPVQMPYLVYRRVNLGNEDTKTPRRGDTMGVEILCVTDQYTSGVELAEKVRAVLESSRGKHIEGLTMTVCTLEDSSEDYLNEAYVQQLIFRILIS